MIVSSSWNRIEIVYGNGPLFTPATVRSSSPQGRAQWSAELQSQRPLARPQRAVESAGRVRLEPAAGPATVKARRSMP